MSITAKIIGLLGGVYNLFALGGPYGGIAVRQKGGTAQGELSHDGTNFRLANGIIGNPMLLSDCGPAGAPVGTCTLAVNGAGVVNGVVQYAYTEVNAGDAGETTLSPIASITASNNTIQVTVPQIRRGMGTRYVYRTKAGGSTFYKVHDFGGGSWNHCTIWNDNVADTALTVVAPTTDTSRVYAARLNNSVKYFCTHPNVGSGAGDLTVLTGDPSTAGCYAIDAYGSIFARCANGFSYGSEYCGTTPGLGHFIANWVSPIDAGQAPVTVFQMDYDGTTYFTPLQMTDGGRRPITVTATFPAVTTAQRFAIYNAITGAGSSSNPQYAMRTDMLPGYTGTSYTYAGYFYNATAGGQPVGAYARADGAASNNTGLFATAANATGNIGVFAALGTSLTPDAIGTSAALVASNGSTGQNIAAFYSNTTLKAYYDPFSLRLVSGYGFTAANKTATQIAANTNDYSPGVGLNQRWSSDASRNVTGMVAVFDGEIRYIWNVGAQNIVLQNENASSTAANRFTCSTGADITLTPNKCAMMMYDNTSTRWRVTLLP